MTGTVNSQIIMRNRIGEIQPLLHVEEPFTIHDIEDHPTRPHDTTRLLHDNGILTKVGSTWTNQHRQAKWRWDAEEKEKIKTWLAEQETFPCGHRATVYNPKWAENYACKVCETEYTRRELQDYLE